MDRPLRTIVVGVADIEGVDPHLEPAIRLAERLQATLFVVHAYRLPDPLLYPYIEMGVFQPELVKGVQEAVQAKLEARVAKLSPRGRVHCRTVPVPADAAIVEVAEKEKADLIMVGATQRGTLSRTVLGTTAQRVVRAAAVPVLVNRRPGHGALRRVLMTTDLSDLSAGVYRRGRAVVAFLAREDEAQFRTLLVVGHDLETPPHLRQQLLDDLLKKELGAFLERTSSAATTARVRLGDPSTEIVAEAVEWGADLLVLGTHGRGGVSRFLIGSVAESVLRAALCDVLVIPAAAVSPPAEVPTPDART
jgi:nucleotide-binding universal stress UspA family protein